MNPCEPMPMVCKLCKNTGRYVGIGKTEQWCGCVIGRAKWLETRPACNEPLRKKSYRIAMQVRVNLEVYAFQHGHAWHLQHLCKVGSAALALALSNANRGFMLCEGVAFKTMHAWVIDIDTQKIIDITFTQFDHDAPRVYVADITDTRWIIEANYHSMHFAFRNVRWIKQLSGTIKRLAKVE